MFVLFACLFACYMQMSCNLSCHISQPAHHLQMDRCWLTPTNLATWSHFRIILPQLFTSSTNFTQLQIRLLPHIKGTFIFENFPTIFSILDQCARAFVCRHAEYILLSSGEPLILGFRCKSSRVKSCIANRKTMILLSAQYSGSITESC